MDPIKVDFTGKGKGSGGKNMVVIPPEKSVLKLIICIIGTAIAAALAFYIMLPPLNFKAAELYYYIAVVIASFIALVFLTSKALTHPEYTPYVKKVSIPPLIIAGVLAVVVVVGMIISSVVFRARDYSDLIKVDSNGKFNVDIAQTDFDTVPRLDEDAAANLASRAMSSLADSNLVSQFTVYPVYTQINYKGSPVRITTLKYANIIKWLTNRSEGLPGYIIIDMANEDTNYFKVEEGIKFSPSEHFGRLLKRHLRFEYPTYMFTNATFEIDDNGNPYWICARIDKTIGLFGGRDVIGAVLVDAVTGITKYYSNDALKNDASLQWIDRVYSSELIVEQYNYYGKYRGGFLNSLLGQKNVIMSSEGYSYLALNDDVYLYTGVTSVTSDQSIIGFALINQRTKDTVFYRVNGAKEMTAKETAEGLVKDYGFVSTFPLLINISGEPTYFMSLKDASNVIQRYALINVKQYNKVKAIGSSLGECLENYIASMKANNVRVDGDIVIPDDEDGKDIPDIEETTVAGIVDDIRSAVLDGESHYYIKLAEGQAYYSIAASDSETVIILNKGANVKITYSSDAAVIIPATKIEILK